MASAATITDTETYSVTDIEIIMRRFTADIVMIATGSAAITEAEARDYTHDIELLAKAGYLEAVDLMLHSWRRRGQGEPLRGQHLCRRSDHEPAGRRALAAGGGPLLADRALAHRRVHRRCSGTDAGQAQDRLGSEQRGYEPFRPETHRRSRLRQ